MEVYHSMLNPFVRKIESLAPLSNDHRGALEGLTDRVYHVGSRERIIEEGEAPHFVNIVLSGWACRYKVLPDGRRQIIALLLPGDMCDPYVFLMRTMDHALGALTPVTLAKVPAQAIRDLTANGPELAEALWWQMLEATEIQREWTISLGRRTAVERLAHLFCEVSVRLGAIGLTNGHECDMPITQGDLADAMGMSTVHVNRSLQEMRANGLIELRGKRLNILDRTRLTELAMFDPTYLQRRFA
jgi:CRP-like cAMP-binding protein